MATSTSPVFNFRLGEHVASESSDSDQSAHSTCSPSSPGAAKKSRAQKKKERKQVGALTDELDILLGAAFQKPSHYSVDADAAAVAQKGSGSSTMEVDATLKKLPKRTRQNMAKMEKRKQRQQDKLQRQAAGAGIQAPILVDQQKQHKQSSKNTTKARRLRKQQERARKVADQANAMEIE